MGPKKQCLKWQNKKNARETFRYASCMLTLHVCSQILFSCLLFHISFVICVKWFTSVVDKHDVRCLIQAAINCQTWHLVSKMLSTGTYNVHGNQTHIFTPPSTRRQRQRVVKLVACISGVDLFTIMACQSCHLNFWGGCIDPSLPTSPADTARHQYRSFPLCHLHQSGKLMGHKTHIVYVAALPSTNQQISSDFLVKVGGRQFLSHFCKCAFHQALPCEIYPSYSSQSPQGPKAIEASYWNCHLIVQNIIKTPLHKQSGNKSRSSEVPFFYHPLLTVKCVCAFFYITEMFGR